MTGPNTTSNRLLAVIATVLTVAMLKWSYSVTMPLAAAILVVAAAWPIKPWLDQRLPSKVSYAGTILALFSVLVLFIAAIYFAVSTVVKAFVVRQDQFRQLYEAYAGWAAERGLPTLGGAGSERLVGIIPAVLAPLYDTLTLLGITSVLAIFVLPEVPALRDKVRERLHESERRELLDTVGKIAQGVRDYLWTMTITSGITGVASGLLAYMIGLDLALVWGVLNFLLNYVPLVGNVVGTIPPAIYAWVQFGSWQTALLVLAAFAVLQALISNVIEPLLQGRSLSLSPVAIVAALSFWGWIWGVAGVLLAVPLTAALVIICQCFPSTEWFAALLAEERR